MHMINRICIFCEHCLGMTVEGINRSEARERWSAKVESYRKEGEV